MLPNRSPYVYTGNSGAPLVYYNIHSYSSLHLPYNTHILRYTLCENIFMGTVGFFFGVIETIVWILSQVGLDLAAYVIWAPFW